MIITDPILLFGVLLLILFVVPIISAKLKIPDIVLFIICGVLVGPHLFGISKDSNIIKDFGYIGLLYILFTAGLEVDLHTIKKRFGEPLLFGILTFIIPFILGYIYGSFYIGLGLASSVLFASLFSSHTVIPFPTVTKLGLLKNRAVTTALGGTIITDVLAMIVLAVTVAGREPGSGIMIWIRLFAMLSILIATGLFVLPFIAGFIFKRISNDDNSGFIFSIGVVFLLGFIAELSGMEKIVGAFLAGIALNRLIPEKSILMNKIRFAGNSLFIPSFLVSVGMIINIKLFASSIEAIITAFVMTLIVVFSKLIAAFITGIINKYKILENLLIFGLTVNQAAATLAAGLIGYEYKMLSEEILAGIIFMIAVTCLIGPIVTAVSGKKLALTTTEVSLANYKRSAVILLPLNIDNDYKRLIDLSLLINDTHNRSSIHTLFVKTDSDENNNFLGQKMLDISFDYGTGASIEIIPEKRFDTNPASGISRAAMDINASIIILQWNKTAQSPFKIFGETIDRLLNLTYNTIMINRLQNPINATKRIVLIIPDYLERFSSFYESLSIIYKFAKELQSEIEIFATKNTIDFIEQAIKNGKLTPLMKEYKKILLRSFSRYNVTESLKSTINKDCFMFLFSERMGGASWQPLFNKLPGLLAENFPQNNLSIVFSRHRDDQIELDQSRKNIYTGNNIDLVGIIQTRNNKLEEELIKTIKRKFRFSIDNKAVPFLTRVLESGLNESILLTGGILFLHYHEGFVDVPSIFIFLNRDGFRYESGNFKAVIILLSPEDYPPDGHIKNLQKIVKLVGTDNFEKMLMDDQRKLDKHIRDFLCNKE